MNYWTAPPPATTRGRPPMPRCSPPSWRSASPSPCRPTPCACICDWPTVPELIRALDPAPDLTAYEELHGRDADEHETLLRRKLHQKTREVQQP